MTTVAVVSRPDRLRRFRQRVATPALVHAFLALLTIWALTPLILMLATSFKPASEVFRLPPQLLPSEFTIENYVTVLAGSIMPQAFINSATTAALVTLITVLIGGTAGYALARFPYRGARQVAVYLLIGQLLPLTALMLPLYTMVSRAGLLDSVVGLAVTHLTTIMPVVVWMSRNAFAAVAIELEEAAEIDGCTKLEAVVAVVLPVVAPSLAAISMFAFLQSWNEYVFASIITSSSASQTAPVALTAFAGQFNTDWGATMAAATVMTVPVAAVFLLLQRQFVQGMSAGAVKG